MKAKFTKDGKASVKLEESLWEVIELAFRREMATAADMEMAQWCLMEECLEKIESRRNTTIKFRLSEFFTLFHERIFRYVDDATTILAWEAFEPLRKEVAEQSAFLATTYLSTH